MKNIYIAIPLICLAASIISGLMGKIIGRRGAHTVTIAGVALACVLSLIVYKDMRSGNIANEVLYTWAVSGGVPFQIGFLIDQLSATMMVIVTFVSLMVHIYTIGYMAEDPGYQRFFCLHLPIYLFHADAGDVQQLPAVVFWLGSGGAGVLFIDRILVRKRHRHLRQHESIPG